MKRNFLVALVLLLLIADWVVPARAQGTAFGYQGRLEEARGPANGSYDFIFAVHGTEAGGNALGQPVRLDALAVNDGRFVARIDFGAGVFTGTSRWLEIAVRKTGSAEPHTVLAPRQSLVPAPYALHAGSASRLLDRAVSAGQLNTAGVAPAAGQFLSFDGGNLLWRDPAASAGDVFSLNGTAAYYTGGNLGIGTSTPAHRLSLAGGPAWTGNRWIGAVDLPNGSALSWQANSAGQRFGLGHANTGFYLFRTQSDPGTIGSPALYDLVVNDAGSVGIGTSTPTVGVKLEVNGLAKVTTGGSGGFLQIGTPNGETGLGVLGANRFDLRFDGAAVKLVAVTGTSPPPPENGITVNTAGNVGIGTTTPVAKLHVAGNVVQDTAGRGFAKAMLNIVETLGNRPVIHDCYNGVSGETPNLNGGTISACGFSVSGGGTSAPTIITFPFSIRNRFLSLTILSQGGAFRGQRPAAVNVTTDFTVEVYDGSGHFHLLVF